MKIKLIITYIVIMLFSIPSFAKTKNFTNSAFGIALDQYMKQEKKDSTAVSDTYEYMGTHKKIVSKLIVTVAELDDDFKNHEDEMQYRVILGVANEVGKTSLHLPWLEVDDIKQRTRSYHFQHKNFYRYTVIDVPFGVIKIYTTIHKHKIFLFIVMVLAEDNNVKSVKYEDVKNMLTSLENSITQIKFKSA